MVPDVRPDAPLDAPPCADCIAHAGLCDRHKRHLLPRLARNGRWLKLMGQALQEQRRLQHLRGEPSVSPEAQAHEARKRAARRGKDRKPRKRRGQPPRCLPSSLAAA